MNRSYNFLKYLKNEHPNTVEKYNNHKAMVLHNTSIATEEESRKLIQTKMPCFKQTIKKKLP